MATLLVAIKKRTLAMRRRIVLLIEPTIYARATYCANTMTMLSLEEEDS